VSRALAALGRDGWLRIVLTNQSAIARGLISEEELGELHADLAAKLARQGGAIDALYYCPHLPDGVARGYAHACTCRKPGRGLLDLALAEHPSTSAASAFIGDSPRDLYADVAGAGPRILLRSGHPLTDTRGADHVADTAGRRGRLADEPAADQRPRPLTRIGAVRRIGRALEPEQRTASVMSSRAWRDPHRANRHSGRVKSRPREAPRVDRPQAA
jgi:histidinol-phosphate phosphatase family protein